MSRSADSGAETLRAAPLRSVAEPPAAAEREPLATAAEVADFLRVHIDTVWAWVRAGLLPQPFYIGPRAPRWSLAEVRAALEKTRARPGEPMARRRGLRTREAA